MWGNDWVCNLDWDPKEWTWRRLGILLETTILNYTTKRGYRIALWQDNTTMRVDAEMEAEGYDSKTRARFFNRIWHPYLPRKVSAMQWLVLTEGLPVGAWRERIGLSNDCQLCPHPTNETLQHAFMDCPEVRKAWELFRNTRRVQNYHQHITPGNTLVEDWWHNPLGLPWTKTYGGTQRQHFLSTQILLGTSSEQISYGLYGASALPTPLRMTFFIWEWFYGMLGETLSNVLWKHIKNCSGTKGTRRNDKKWSHAFRKYGHQQTYLADFKGRTSSGILPLTSSSCQGSLEPGPPRQFRFIAFHRRQI